VITRELENGSRLALQFCVVQFVLTLTLSPVEAAEVLRALRAVMLSARLERRCRRAQILRDIDAPDLVCYVEEWPAREDIDSRICTGSFSHLLALMEANSSHPSIEFRIVTEVHGLEYVAVVRDSVSAPSPEAQPG
jgi:quinol monooxygenase YgiN